MAWLSPAGKGHSRLYHSTSMIIHGPPINLLQLEEFTTDC
jgi:hypothetical protein